MKIIILLIITGLSICDIKYKKISIVGPVLLILSGGVLMFAQKAYGFHLMGLIPGIITVIVAHISEECIGMGDALVIMSLGFCVGIVEIINVVLLSSICLFFVAAIKLLKRKNRNIKVAFIPFLLLGYVGGIVL